MAKVSTALKQYPDISKQLEAKAAHRRKYAARPIVEKLEVAARLRDANRLLKSARLVSAPAGTENSK